MCSKQPVIYLNMTFVYTCIVKAIFSLPLSLSPSLSVGRKAILSEVMSRKAAADAWVKNPLDIYTYVHVCTYMYA